MGVVPKKKKDSTFRKPKTKLVISFDEEARRDYLTGFSKRKNERRVRAQEQLEEQAKEARRLRRAEIKERVMQLRSLAEEDTVAAGAGEAGEGESGEPALEQSEVQYSDDELVTTVVTTTEVTPISLQSGGEADKPWEEEDDEDDGADALKEEIEKKQKVQEAIYAIKALKKQPMPQAPQPKSKSRGGGRGGHHHQNPGAIRKGGKRSKDGDHDARGERGRGGGGRGKKRGGHGKSSGARRR